MWSTHYSCQILMKLKFARRVFEEYENIMKICSMGAELFHADGRTDRHDEANILFSQFCELD